MRTMSNSRIYEDHYLKTAIKCCLGMSRQIDGPIRPDTPRYVPIRPEEGPWRLGEACRGVSGGLDWSWAVPSREN